MSENIREKIGRLRHDSFGCGTYKCPHWQKDCFNYDWVIHNGLCAEMKDQLLALFDEEGIRKQGFEEGYQKGQQHSIGTDTRLVKEAKREERERIIEYIENYELFTNYSGDFRAVLISELKRQTLKQSPEGG